MKKTRNDFITEASMVYEIGAACRRLHEWYIEHDPANPRRDMVWKIMRGKLVDMHNLILKDCIQETGEKI